MKKVRKYNSMYVPRSVVNKISTIKYCKPQFEKVHIRDLINSVSTRVTVPCTVSAPAQNGRPLPPRTHRHAHTSRIVISFVVFCCCRQGSGTCSRTRTQTNLILAVNLISLSSSCSLAITCLLYACFHFVLVVRD